MPKTDTWIAALLALIAGLIFYPFVALGVDPHHDGIMLKPVLDVLSGQVLFRDTFSQYGPLTTYLQALALAFNPTLISLRVLTVLSYAGSYWAITPAVGVFIYCCYWILQLAPISGSLALLLLISPAAYHKYRWGQYNLGLPRVSLDSPSVLRGIRMEPDFAAAIQRAQSSIVNIWGGNPDRPVMLYGDDALYLTWFPNRENPSPYYVTWKALITPDEKLKRWRFWVGKKPVVLLNGPSANEHSVIPQDYELVMHEPLLKLRILAPGLVGRPPASINSSVAPEGRPAVGL